MKFSEQIKTSKTDEYYTPDYAVKIILPYLKNRGFKKSKILFGKIDWWRVKKMMRKVMIDG